MLDWSVQGRVYLVLVGWWLELVMMIKVFFWGGGVIHFVYESLFPSFEVLYEGIFWYSIWFVGVIVVVPCV